MSKRYICKVVVKNGDKVRTVLSVRAIADMRFVKRWYYQKYQQKDGDVFVICSDEEAVWRELQALPLDLKILKTKNRMY